MVGALESAGLEVLDVEALRRHYAMTLRAWVQNLEEHWDDVVAATSEGRGAGLAAVHDRERAGLRRRDAGREPGAAAAAGRGGAAVAASRVGLSAGSLCVPSRLRW